jgi:hypothetical protein
MATATTATPAHAAPNSLDVVPDKIPFDVPYGAPILLERAQAAINAVVSEAKTWLVRASRSVFSQRSRVTPAFGWEQHTSTFPGAGLSSGSGL